MNTLYGFRVVVNDTMVPKRQPGRCGLFKCRRNYRAVCLLYVRRYGYKPLVATGTMYKTHDTIVMNSVTLAQLQRELEKNSVPRHPKHSGNPYSLPTLWS